MSITWGCNRKGCNMKANHVLKVGTGEFGFCPDHYDDALRARAQYEREQARAHDYLLHHLRHGTPLDETRTSDD